MAATHPVNELIDQIVTLEHARDALEDVDQRRNVARVIRQLRERLGVGVPKRRAAAALGISPQALERWVLAGRLPVTKRPGSSRELIDTRALLALVARSRQLASLGEERPVSKALKTLVDDRRLVRRRPNQRARELRYEFVHSSAQDRLRATVALSEAMHVMVASGESRRARRAS